MLKTIPQSVSDHTEWPRYKIEIKATYDHIEVCTYLERWRVVLHSFLGLLVDGCTGVQVPQPLMFHRKR